MCINFRRSTNKFSPWPLSLCWCRHAQPVTLLQAQEHQEHCFTAHGRGTLRVLWASPTSSDSGSPTHRGHRKCNCMTGRDMHMGLSLDSQCVWYEKLRDRRYFKAYCGRTLCSQRQHRDPLCSSCANMGEYYSHIGLIQGHWPWTKREGKVVVMLTVMITPFCCWKTRFTMPNLSATLDYHPTFTPLDFHWRSFNSSKDRGII